MLSVPPRCQLVGCYENSYWSIFKHREIHWCSCGIVLKLDFPFVWKCNVKRCTMVASKYQKDVKTLCCLWNVNISHICIFLSELNYDNLYIAFITEAWLGHEKKMSLHSLAKLLYSLTILLESLAILLCSLAILLHSLTLL